MQSTLDMVLNGKRPAPRLKVRWGFDGYPSRTDEYGLIAYGGQMARGAAMVSFCRILPNGMARGI